MFRVRHDNVAYTPDTSAQALPEGKVMVHDQSKKEVPLKLSPNVHTLSPVPKHSFRAPSSSNLSTKSLTFSPNRTQWAMNASNKIRPRRWSSFFFSRIVQQFCTIRRPSVVVGKTSRFLVVGTKHVEHDIDSRRHDHGARLLHHALQVQAQRQTKDFPSEPYCP